MSSSATTSAASASPENADQNEEVTLKIRKLQLSHSQRTVVLQSIMNYLIHNSMFNEVPIFIVLLQSCKGVEIIYEACLHRIIEIVNGCEMIKVTSEEIAEWVRRLKSISNNVSSSEEESSEEDEQWVACDYCGEKNINPEDLCFDKNLADIGGGYAHDACMTEEQLEEWEKAAGRSDY